MTLANFGLTESAVTILIFLYAALFLLIFSAALILFYLKGFGIYRMSRTLKIKRSWQAFVPFLNVAAFGKIADASNGKKSSYEKILFVFYTLKTLVFAVFLGLAISFLVKLIFAADQAVFDGKELSSKIFFEAISPVIAFLISVLLCLIYNIINAVCAVKVYKKFGDDAAVLKAIIGVLIPITFPCFVYSICKNEPGEKKESLAAEDSVFYINE